jgi:hypothetical protein
MGVVLVRVVHLVSEVLMSTDLLGLLYLYQVMQLLLQVNHHKMEKRRMYQ